MVVLSIATTPNLQKRFVVGAGDESERFLLHARWSKKGSNQSDNQMKELEREEKEKKMRGKAPLDSKGPSVSDMLDDIEATSGRLYSHTSALKREADQHNEALSNINKDMCEKTSMLHEEALYIARVRKVTNDGVCWMYGVIALEVLILVFLLNT